MLQKNDLSFLYIAVFVITLKLFWMFQDEETQNQRSKLFFSSMLRYGDQDYKDIINPKTL
jgi:hypothetical protein